MGRRADMCDENQFSLCFLKRRYGKELTTAVTKIPKAQLPGRRNELFWPVASELSVCTPVDCGSEMRQGHQGAGST